MIPHRNFRIPLASAFITLVLIGCAAQPSLNISVPTATSVATATAISMEPTSLPSPSASPAEPTPEPAKPVSDTITTGNAGDLSELNRWVNPNDIGIFHIQLAGDQHTAYAAVDSEVFGFDAATSEITETYSLEYPSYVRNIVISPDDSLLAIAYEIGKVQLIDLIAGRTMLEIADTSATLESNTVDGIAFSPTDPVIALGQQNGKIGIYSTDDGALLDTIENYSKDIWDLSYSSDGSQLAASDIGGTIRVWETASHKLIGTFKGMSAVFSPDGTYLAYLTEDALILVDTLTGQSKLTISRGAFEGLGVFGDIDGGLSIHPAGTLLAAGHYGGTLTIWDAQTGSLLKSIPVVDNPVDRLRDMDWSNDGSMLITIAEGDKFSIWGLE